MSDKKTLYCSFCGKSQYEVRKLIAGPGTFICNECVNLCSSIIVDEGGLVSKNDALLASVEMTPAILEGITVQFVEDLKCISSAGSLRKEGPYTGLQIFSMVINDLQALREEPWRQAGAEGIDSDIKNHEAKLEKMKERRAKLKATVQAPGDGKSKTK